VPLNPAYTFPELSGQIRKTKIKAIIGWDQRMELLRRLRTECALSFMVVCHGRQNQLLNRKEGSGHRVNAEKEKEIRFEDLISNKVQDLVLPGVAASQPALFQFSGGTTGTPKAAVALHRNIVANVMQFRRWLVNLEDGNEQFLTVIPLSHVYGMVIGLNVGIAMGATINLIADPRDTKEIIETIQRNGITFYPGVPTMYHAINQNEDVKAGKFDLSSIKACISGSAPLLSEIRERFEKLTGGKLVEGYGLSEAPTATHCNPVLGENRNGSIGLPLPDVECKLSSSKELAVGTGELCIKSPQVMAGYFDDEEETENVFEDGWLKTGDIARMDNDGYFYLVGRRKDLIKVGGLQVWPQEVEAAIAKNPEIKEVVVAGVPSLSKGEKVKAWVVLKEGSQITRDQIVKNCAGDIAYFKVPKDIEFLDVIPHSPVGKVLRRELVKRELGKKYRE
jgi:long-chain acyl-CoA synthetase